jgi:tight adherence protein C
MNLPAPNLLVLRIAACSATAVALFTFTWVIVSTPQVEGKRLGLRGLKRKRALQKTPLWSSLEPIVRWLGARFSALLSDEQKASLNLQIALAGDYMGLLPEELIGFCIVSGILGIFAGSIAGYTTGMGGVMVIGCTLLGSVLPLMQVSGAAADRLKNINRRLPYAIDLLALAMGAGLDFPGAVRQVVEKSGSPEEPVVEEFTLILQSLQLGRTRRQALEEFSVRAPINSVLEFVGAVVQAELRGNPVVEVLRIQAEVSRRQRSVRAEESASKAGVAMIVPLVLVFVAILILIVAPIVMKLQKET